jgi:hypothetical protein
LFKEKIMGLDQYAYTAAKAGAYNEYYEDENYEKEDSDPTKQSKPRELAYWRKHPNLQGWMKRLWEEKNPDDVEVTSFNGIEARADLGGFGKIRTGHHFWWPA